MNHSPYLNIYFLSFFYIIFPASGFSQSGTSLQKLNQELQTINNAPTMKHAGWGFSLRSVKTGKIITEINSDRTLTTASTMKLVTTGAALGLLGNDFTFKTYLEYDGHISPEGTLKGNIYIRGGGDPTLGSNRIKGSLNTIQLMLLWIDQIKKAGIKSIEGSVIGDAEIFEENNIPKGWQWNDIGNYYGAGANGLNINENFYTICFKPGKQGEATSILRIEPEIQGLEFANAVTTGKIGSGDNAYIYGAPGSYFRFIQGTIPAGVKEFEIKGSVPDAALLCAQLLRKELENQRIKVSEPATTAALVKRVNKNTGKERTQIYEHASPPMKDIVHEINSKSLNLYAESVLKIIGKEVLNEGSTEAGLTAIQDFWKKKGLNTSSGFFMEDGSGLSPANSLTPRHQADICYIMSKEPTFETFYSSLSEAGVSGTLSTLAKGTAAQGNLRAKSGTITRVICYTGYVKNRAGETLCFSMMVNKYDGDYYSMRKRFEKLMILMAEL